MKMYSIWACPLKRNLPRNYQEQISASGVGLSASSLLVLCNVCMAAVASCGRLLAQQTFCKVLRRAFRYNPSRGQYVKASEKITFLKNKT
jgi:hypothetical protein